jgi:DNA-binding PadR family transcriptional regulator
VVATIKHDHYTVMPLFVLALVSKGGLNTLYALQHEAGLQPGGVQPVLRQLERDGLLLRSEEGKRRRRVMVVTDKGQATLAAHWHGCLDLYWDVESVLRAATVALLMDVPRVASAYLLNMAYEYDRKSSDSRTSDPDDRASLVEWYGYMRTHCETSRLRSAAQALRTMAKTIEASMKVQSRTNEPQAEWWKVQ